LENTPQPLIDHATLTIDPNTGEISFESTYNLLERHALATNDKEWTINVWLTFDDTDHGSYGTKAATVIQHSFTLITTDPCRGVNSNTIDHVLYPALIEMQTTVKKGTGIT